MDQRVDSLPVAANSSSIVRSIGTPGHLHPDFGSGLWNGIPIGIPITVVSRATPRSAVSFDYADESDPRPVPDPERTSRSKAEATRTPSSSIATRASSTSCLPLRRTSGRWRAGSGAIWNLASNQLRPAGWTSADAAGLPIRPGLARYDEVALGRIDHALRFTVSRTRRAYVWRARHFASSRTDPSLPPMGLRIRLKAGYNITGFPPQAASCSGL